MNNQQTDFEPGFYTFMDYYSMIILIVAGMMLGGVLLEPGRLFWKIVYGFLIIRRLAYIHRRLGILERIERKLQNKK